MGLAELSDTALTERGLKAGEGQVLILACGALAREILAVVKANRWGHLALHCLPAKLHLYPDQIVSAVADAVEKNRAHYRNIYVAYGDCGTGGLLQKKCAELGVEMISGPHCYSFFEGNVAFGARMDDEITAFYLTDFLVRQFDAFVWKPMGLDRHPELLDSYFGNYTKLVYQAQTKDSVLEERAREAAQRLKLAYEYRFTGYGDLAVTLSDWAGRSSVS